MLKYDEWAEGYRAPVVRVVLLELQGVGAEREPRQEPKVWWTTAWSEPGSEELVVQAAKSKRELQLVMGWWRKLRLELKEAVMEHHMSSLEVDSRCLLQVHPSLSVTPIQLQASPLFPFPSVLLQPHLCPVL
jgi:hypothetical protein